MQNNPQLAKDELSLEQAVKLIQADTPSKATVDLQWLANNIDYIREFNNFRIPIARNATKGELAERMEMRRQHPGYRISPITITNSDAYVRIVDIYTKETLKKAIREAYRDHTKRELEVDKVYNKTTVFDPEHNTQSRVQVGKNEGTKKGEGLGNGEVTK